MTNKYSQKTNKNGIILWWFNPVWIAIAWGLLCIASFYAPEHLYMQIMKTNKYVNGQSMSMMLLFLLCLGTGSLISILIFSKIKRLDKGRALLERMLSTATLRLLYICIFAVVAMAYIMWFAPTLQPDIFLAVLQGGDPTLGRTFGNQISGITTLTQLGIFLSVLSAYAIYSENVRNRLLFKIVFGLLVIFAFYRSLIWSERLALIEIIVPFAILTAQYKYRGQLYLKVLPIIGIVFLVLVFAFFESFRSWHFYKDYYDNIIDFAALRLASYYFSSFNNFAMLQEEYISSFQPINTFAFVYKFPLFPWLNEIYDDRTEQMKMLLQNYTHPEFNLFTAAGLIYDDLGTLGSCIMIFVFGLISGYFYVAFKKQYLMGMILYPIWMIGLLDFGRTLHWTSGRAFPAYVMAIVFFFLFHNTYNRVVLNRGAAHLH